MFIIDWILNLFRSEKPGAVVQEPEPAPEPVSPPSAVDDAANTKAEAAVAKKKAVKKKAEPKAEPKITKASLNRLTKAQLEERGREVGVELDKRKKKADLVEQLYTHLK